MGLHCQALRSKSQGETAPPMDRWSIGDPQGTRHDTPGGHTLGSGTVHGTHQGKNPEDESFRRTICSHINAKAKTVRWHYKNPTKKSAGNMDGNGNDNKKRKWRDLERRIRNLKTEYITAVTRSSTSQRAVGGVQFTGHKPETAHACARTGGWSVHTSSGGPLPHPETNNQLPAGKTTPLIQTPCPGGSSASRRGKGAETLLADHVASFLHDRGYTREAIYINRLAGWHESADGRGLSEDQRQEKNDQLMNAILDEIMPWHRGEELVSLYKHHASVDEGILPVTVIRALRQVDDLLSQQLGTKHKLTTAYHPQTNGLDERTNVSLLEFMSGYLNQTSCDQLTRESPLPGLEFMLRQQLMAQRGEGEGSVGNTTNATEKPAAESIDPYWLKFGTGYQTETSRQGGQKKMAKEHQGLNQDGKPGVTESFSTNEDSPLSPQQTSRPRDWVVVVRTWMQECGEPGNGNQEDRRGSPTITRKDWIDCGATFCQVPFRLRGSQSRSTKI
ncbi:carbohydrate binding [Branchiostoma belcheri]|nr:carbohydrate binding [Branchiostoma belcheri]